MQNPRSKYMPTNDARKRMQVFTQDGGIRTKYYRPAKRTTTLEDVMHGILGVVIMGFVCVVLAVVVLGAILKIIGWN